MDTLSPDQAATATLVANADAAFRQAIAAGRSLLSNEQQQPLLDALGVPHVDASSPVTGELRIRVHNSREFGLVISVGLGGLDAELDDGHLFRSGRATVHAATAMVNPATLLRRFRHTLPLHG